MKAIMVMFDSLNRRMLPPYGCDWVHAPNFARLAERTVTFDNSFVGSMPCMPARRELHTGRYNFLHRSWGPLEPFDDSMPELLKENGVYSHLVSDHGHYWEDGGCTYHTRYSTWEIARGHEGDPWKGHVEDPEIPESVSPREGKTWRQDWVNRQHMTREEDQPQAVTFSLGLEFIETNHASDNWFLQIETFDPHEPFFTQQEYKELYPHNYDGPHFDWPQYKPVSETPEQVEHCRHEYAASLSMCDAQLGKVLDAMDRHGLWDDTMLIVNTDHGFLLGEHDWWAKCVMPFYNEVANSPLFIWDPRSGACNEHRSALVQTIDLPATLLEYFCIPLPEDMQGVPLRETIASDTPVREAALYGLHGGHVNCTDGRHVYMRAPVSPENQPLYNYTHMPTHMRARFSIDEMQQMEIAPPFSFTKGCPVMRIPGKRWQGSAPFEDLLFDLKSDPGQEVKLSDPEIVERMTGLMVQLMAENDAPDDQYQRLGLPKPE
jgi:arylsulfatase A-like enzyme